MSNHTEPVKASAGRGDFTEDEDDYITTEKMRTLREGELNVKEHLDITHHRRTSAHSVRSNAINARLPT